MKEIFVFGSNLAGSHAGGAAKFAAENYGAIAGVDEGMAGNSYAIPTMTWSLKPRTLGAINKSVATFLRYAAACPEKKFKVTRIGCGIAGYTDAQIAPMFKGASDNCVFDPEWSSFGLTSWNARRFALVLRTVNKNLRSHGGFQWPKNGFVKCSDWNPDPVCGGGLHGLLWGVGDYSLVKLTDISVKWQVVRVDESKIIMIDKMKCKFPEGEVIYTGNQADAMTLILCDKWRIDNLLSTVKQPTTGEYSPSATSGWYSPSATTGESSPSATSGWYSPSRVTGKHSIAAALGRESIVSAGETGCIAAAWWDEKSHRIRLAVGYVGEEGIQPNTDYVVKAGKFVKSK